MASRRLVLQQMLVIAGGAFLLPACFQDKGSALLPFKKLHITGDQGETLRQLAATILPKTATGPGADELHAHLFALKMADDCLPAKDQRRFEQGITAFDNYCKTSGGSAFTGLAPAKKITAVSALDKNKKPTDETDDLGFFYQSMKLWTVQAYITSEDYLTKVKNYHIIPGKFVGSVPVAVS